MTKQISPPCGWLIWPFLCVLKRLSAGGSGGYQRPHFLQGPRLDLADPLG
jgi:hypothetical protein